MKYIPPKQGTYESGLTAKLMYNLVDGLIKKHITPEAVKRIDEHYGSPSPAKLWEKPEIRSELEEFVISYLLDNLQPPLPGFEDVFKREGGRVKIEAGNLENYVGRLEQEYSSRDEAHRIIFELFGKVKKRGERLYGEIDKIYNVKGKQLIQHNARDAFGHIAAIYSFIELDIREIGIPHQS
ncbi:MAG: hypothetical protein AABX34_01470 [Nanoarchaeota archaeon]